MELKRRLWKAVIGVLIGWGVPFAVQATGYKIETIAGNGKAGYSGDGGYV